MTDLAGLVALVTGGGRRLGRAISEGLADAGARVAVHFHASADGARAVADRYPGLAVPIAADLRDAGQAEELPRRVAAQHGRLDVVVNSAAVMVRQPFGEVTPADWDAVIGLNLRAYFFVAQGAAPSLRERHGSIINIADASAIDPWPSYLPHSVAKAGVQSLTRGLAQVLAPEVRVNGIIPGAVLLPEGTSAEERQRIIDRTPLGRIGTPEAVVAAVLFLLGADYVTGSTTVVDGGATIRPRGDG